MSLVFLIARSNDYSCLGFMKSRFISISSPSKLETWKATSIVTLKYRQDTIKKEIIFHKVIIKLLKNM